MAASSNRNGFRHDHLINPCRIRHHVSGTRSCRQLRAERISNGISSKDFLVAFDQTDLERAKIRQAIMKSVRCLFFFFSFIATLFAQLRLFPVFVCSSKCLDFYGYLSEKSSFLPSSSPQFASRTSLNTPILGLLVFLFSALLASTHQFTFSFRASNPLTYLLDQDAQDLALLDYARLCCRRLPCKTLRLGKFFYQRLCVVFSLLLENASY